MARIRLLPLALWWVAVAPLAATTLTVDTLNDENNGCTLGACSLREAIGAAGSGDTIQFSVTGTITLTLGELAMSTSNVTITGPGAGSLTVSGNFGSRVFHVASGVSGASISGLTIANGRLGLGDPHGGGLRNDGILALSGVTVTLNQAFSQSPFDNFNGGDGGGIWNTTTGHLSIDLSTISLTPAGPAGAHPGGGAGPAGGRGGGIFNAGTLTVTNSTISGNQGGAGGQPTGNGGFGGGVYNDTGAVATIDGSTIATNKSGDGGQFCPFTCVNGPDGRGGGFYNAGELNLNNSTISGNGIGSSGGVGTAAPGGGIDSAAGTLRMRCMTVVANSSGNGGGGLQVEGGTAHVRDSLLATNSSGTTHKDCEVSSGTLTSDQYNLVGVVDGCSGSFTGANHDQTGTSGSPLNPLIGVLAANGGPTQTHALQTGSPAIDHAHPAGCVRWDPNTLSDVALVVDQRGSTRPTDGDGDTVVVCDDGAYEAPAVAPAQHLLSVSVTGAGLGSVTSNPTGINCPGDCSESYVFTTQVTLTATPSAGSYFIGWTGDCTGTGGCQVTMSQDRNVGAQFGILRTLAVTIAGTGGGSVGSSPPGISCPGTCSFQFVDGTPVTLTATPDGSSIFSGWSGDCSGTAPCPLAMTADHSATATFLPHLIFADGFETGDMSLWSLHVP